MEWNHHYLQVWYFVPRNSATSVANERPGIQLRVKVMRGAAEVDKHQMNPASPRSLGRMERLNPFEEWRRVRFGTWGKLVINPYPLAS